MVSKIHSRVMLGQASCNSMNFLYLIAGMNVIGLVYKTMIVIIMNVTVLLVLVVITGYKIMIFLA